MLNITEFWSIIRVQNIEYKILEVKGMKNRTDTTKIIEAVEKIPKYNDIILSKEFYYSSLPLAVMDAIFSIGVKYKGVENVINRYCEKYQVNPNRNNSETVHKNSDLANNIDSVGAEIFANNIVCNRQRTSTKNGILKVEAVLEWAKILSKNNIETFGEFNSSLSCEIEDEMKSVKGQSSGISLNYLKMLCGDDDTCKPDRHVIRFLSDALGYEVSVSEVQEYLEKTVEVIKKTNKKMSVRLFDYIIWSYMANNK